MQNGGFIYNASKGFSHLLQSLPIVAMASLALPLSAPLPALQPPRRSLLPIFARRLRPVEERYRIYTERNITPERAQELGISRWRRWETGKTHYSWEWRVDEQVYVAKGSLQVTPRNCEDSAWFYAGDLVRFPKWFAGTLEFEDDYEERYRFCAYGDD